MDCTEEKGERYITLEATLLLDKMTDTRRRVKLYALNAERQWDDKGTGHVSSTYVERLKGISLLVRAESDGERSFSPLQLTSQVLSTDLT